MKISLKALAEDCGCDSVDELLEEYAYESIMPALCSEGCEVEPDGTCEHGNPSLFLALLSV